MTINAYPLAWPAGWPRKKDYQRGDARFTAHGKPLSIIGGVERVLAELDRMGRTRDDVVISTNVETRLDGFPRSDRVAPADPGCAVYWRTKAGETKVMAIDRYNRVADNLAAIAATLEAMRAIERHGGATILDRAFAGFNALPAPGAARPWWTVLGFDSQHVPADAIQSAYRRLRSEHHPDRGGSAERFDAVEQAWRQAQEAGRG